MYPWESPPHKKESNKGRFSRYCWSPSPPCCCENWLCSAGSCFHPHPRTAVIRVRTSMLVTSFELSASTADAVLEFSGLCLPVPSSLLHLVTLREVRDHEFLGIRDAPRHCASTVQSDQSGSRALPSRLNHCTSSRCSAIQSCLLDVSVRQCLLVFKLFSCEDQSLLILTSKLDHFFTRASWATTVILSTITLFLITSRIECVTTFAQAFQRSDQTARCAMHRTFRVAG